VAICRTDRRVRAKLRQAVSNVTSPLLSWWRCITPYEDSAHAGGLLTKNRLRFPLTDSGNGLQRNEPRSLSGSGRTSSRPLASRVTVTVLPCEARRAAVARSIIKRWPSETTA
jgi:hypothetical protein